MQRIIFTIICIFLVTSVSAQTRLDDIIIGISNKESKKEKVNSMTFDTGDNNIDRRYRGFVDFGFGFGYDTNEIEISTTHGYQILPDYLFVGMGLGYWYLCAYQESALPIFADITSDFYSFGKFSLFVGAKVGYAVLDMSGVFLESHAGIRYGLTNKLGLNLGIGSNTIINTDYLVGNSFFHIKLGVDF